MKGMIVAFGAALVVGLGGGAVGAYLQVQRLNAAATPPVTAADSAKLAAAGDSLHGAKPDSMATLADSTALLATADTTHAPAAGATLTDTSLATAPDAHTAAPSSLASAPAVKAAPSEAEVRVGKSLAAMPPRDAARVLAQMNDAEVVQVLSAVADRKAAAILAQLPPEKAAAVVRAGLKGER